MRFKVGDLVRVREWEDMKKEFGCDDEGDIQCRGFFTPNMRQYCGKTDKIIHITRGGLYQLENAGIWKFSDNMLLEGIRFTFEDLVARLEEEGKPTKFAKDVLCAFEDALESQRAFDFPEEGIEEMMRITYKRTCYARSLSGYLAAAYEVGYLSAEEYNQAASSIGVAVYG